MFASRYNLTVPFGEGEVLILNSLTGAMDLASSEEGAWLAKLPKAGGKVSEGVPHGMPSDLSDYFLERGYAWSSLEEEEQALDIQRRAFAIRRKESPTQIILVLSYDCNLGCTYCFQHADTKDTTQKVWSAPHLSPEEDKKVLEALFSHLEKRFAGEALRPYITLFGGEPLLNTPGQREKINYVQDRCRELGFGLAVVTNGVTLAEYAKILDSKIVKEIQVTLDGPPEIHDKRRPYKGGQGTFKEAVEGIEAALAKGFPINLRMVLDRENIAGILPLAEYCDAKGWLDLPLTQFKTQYGRNYELIDPNPDMPMVFSRLEMWAEIARLGKTHPVVAKFHRPGFVMTKYLADNGSLPQPLFDSCPAGKEEWAYDHTGKIYGCTANVGREEYSLGTYYPEETWAPQLEEWVSRSIDTIPECRECPSALLCGGGCGTVAKEQTGRVHGPDCRPIPDLIALGADYYHAELKKLIGS